MLNMKSQYKKLILLGAGIFGAVAMQAQDLRTELKGERKVTPIEREANRPGFMPRLYTPQPAKTDLKVTEYGNVSEITPGKVRLEPVAFMDTIGQTPYRGYASLGYFPSYNLGASAGYRFINTHRTRLSGWMEFDGSSYDGLIEPDSDLKEKYKSNAIAGGFRLDHRVGLKSLLSARIGGLYNHLTAPFYGNDPDVMKMPYYNFGGGAEWWSSVGRLGYHASLGIDRFGYSLSNVPVENFNPELGITKLGSPAETQFSFGAGAVYGNRESTMYGGLDIKGQLNHRNVSNSTKNIGLIKFTPYFGFNGEKLQGHLGLNVDVQTGHGAKTHLSPEVLVNWRAMPQFALYARVNGGDRVNTYATGYEICMWSNPGSEHFISNVPVDATLGLNIGPFAGLSFEIWAGYASAKSWETLDVFPGYVMTKPSPWNTLWTASDMKGAHFGARVAYDYRGIVKAEVSAEATPDYDKYDEGYYFWRDRAKFDLRASLTVSPIKPLDITASYNVRTGRHTFAYGSFDVPGEDEEGGLIIAPEEISLGRVSDLSFSASYKINSQFTVFARAENVLNKRHWLSYSIESPGVRGLIGLAYQF